LGKIFSGDARELDPQSWSEPEVLKQTGWKNSVNDGSGTSGKSGPWQIADVPDDGYSDGKLASLAIEKLASLKANDKPFFLAAGFFKPHLPFNAPKRYWDLYDPESFDLHDDGKQVDQVSIHAHHSHRELGAYRRLVVANFDLAWLQEK
jgi:arylsulfatase A-like enzyme